MLFPETTATARYLTFASSAVARAVTRQVPTFDTFVEKRVVSHLPLESI